eukprot:scaffold96404_cov118-Phaeocystis_antarctica.AAC.2
MHARAVRVPASGVLYVRVLCVPWHHRSRVATRRGAGTTSASLRLNETKCREVLYGDQAEASGVLVAKARNATRSGVRVGYPLPVHRWSLRPRRVSLTLTLTAYVAGAGPWRSPRGQGAMHVAWASDRDDF